MDIINPREDINISSNENQVEKVGYLYRHIGLDTNMPFYIGISASNNGKYTRAYDKGLRSNEWKDVISNTEYKVEIVLKDLPYSMICEKERYFIKLYGRIDLGTGTIVNKTSGGQHGDQGRIVSDKTRKLISVANSGKTRTDEEKKRLSIALKKLNKGKPIAQYDLNGSLVKTFKNIASTEDDGFDEKTVASCCRLEKKKTHKGYTFRFIDDNKIENTIDSSYNIKKYYTKMIAQYDLSGNFIKTYESISSTEKDNFDSSCVNHCCIGTYKTHKNFIWRYVIDSIIENKIDASIAIKKYYTNRVARYDLEGKLVKVYESLASTIDDGFNESCVSSCCYGKYKAHKGFMFKYINDDIIIEKIDAVKNTLKYRRIPIGQYKYNVLIKIYESATSAVSDGFCNSMIGSCCKGKIKQYKGFTWKYMPIETENTIEVKVDENNISKHRRKPLGKYDQTGVVIN